MSLQKTRKIKLDRLDILMTLLSWAFKGLFYPKNNITHSMSTYTWCQCITQLYVCKFIFVRCMQKLHSKKRGTWSSKRWARHAPSANEYDRVSIGFHFVFGGISRWASNNISCGSSHGPKVGLEVCFYSLSLTRTEINIFKTTRSPASFISLLLVTCVITTNVYKTYITTQSTF